jgi:hypothetical protein
VVFRVGRGRLGSHQREGAGGSPAPSIFSVSALSAERGVYFLRPKSASILCPVDGTVMVMWYPALESLRDFVARL